jgi:hypothetical protein
LLHLPELIEGITDEPSISEDAEGDGPDIGEIAEAIVKAMDSHSLLELATAEERHFAFVSERLHNRIRVYLPNFVDQIIGESSSDLEHVGKEGKEADLQRQRLANGPDDPIGPSCDETDFESGRRDAGPFVNEPTQALEDDSGQDIQQDHRPTIGAVTETSRTEATLTARGQILEIAKPPPAMRMLEEWN